MRCIHHISVFRSNFFRSLGEWLRSQDCYAQILRASSCPILAGVCLCESKALRSFPSLSCLARGCIDSLEALVGVGCRRCFADLGAYSVKNSLHVCKCMKFARYCQWKLTNNFSLNKIICIPIYCLYLQLHHI